MHSRRLFRVSAVIATVGLSSVLAFQPGADYGLANTTNLYNCSGSLSASNVTATDSADTLPQIEPLSAAGWEKWDFFMHGTFPIILRWSQGDQSQGESTPSVGKIDVVILNVNGTDVRTTVTGPITYKNGAVKVISIGENTIQWDAAAQWYNVTLCVDGYSLVLNTYQAMLDTFHPNVGHHNGRLSSVGDPAVYGSVPIPRGHSSGYLATPDEQYITLDGLTVLKHTFSEKALPPYINRYTTAVAWGYSRVFYDTHIFFQIDEANGTVHEAAYLGRAIPVPGSAGIFQTTSVTYAVTDDEKLYHLSTSGNAINATLPGCAATSNISYAFNMTTGSILGEFTDMGGGTTTYYTLNGTTLAPFGGNATNGTLAGVLEVYQGREKQ